MAKIAVELKRALTHRAKNGMPGRASATGLARGAGWSVADVICTSGPDDRPFEECHGSVTIAVVVAGSFQYRSKGRTEVMSPGSLMLGTPGQCFECGHEHAFGDRCIAFSFEPDYFEELSLSAQFQRIRLPSLRETSPVVARCCAAIAGGSVPLWEELGVQLAVHAVALENGSGCDAVSSPSAEARVTRVLRSIEERSADPGLSLRNLAREARLSPCHFLRIFENLTGLTPHQYLMRVRLREAAIKLAQDSSKVVDIALDCGFGDVSNFNRSFGREFGMSPRAYRADAAR